ncbi:MAG TPA: SprT-like domain-containing protein [Microbacteriaceae bacterium]|nr:SprT-like domain-containing protein [Microbacteriaceae bacterium]
MAELTRVRIWAEALIALHLDASWTFAFDTAKTRAGLCDHSRRRISVSRYLAVRFEDDAIHQVLLHEVAHALAGPRAGHGARWLGTARELGYTGGRTHDGPIAIERAPWVGTCPGGHEHVRFRRPSRPMSCGRCNRRYDPTNAIVWRRRAA